MNRNITCLNIRVNKGKEIKHLFVCCTETMKCHFWSNIINIARNIKRQQILHEKVTPYSNRSTITRTSTILGSGEKFYFFIVSFFKHEGSTTVFKTNSFKNIPGCIEKLVKSSPHVKVFWKGLKSVQSQSF